MRKLSLALVAVFVGGVVVGCRPSDELKDIPDLVKKEDLLKSGWKLYKEGKFDSSFAKFDSVITYMDATDLEAHLGRGLSAMRLGDFALAHKEFGLLYSQYVKEEIRSYTLYVPDAQQDTIGGGKSNVQMVCQPLAALPSGGNYTMGVWKMGVFADANNPSQQLKDLFEDSDYIYFPVDVLTAKVVHDGGGDKTIDPATFGLAFTPTAQPLTENGGSLSYTDTAGPVFMYASSVSGASEEPILCGWMYDGNGDTVKVSFVSYRISKQNPLGGENPALVWIALAADAYAYYTDPSFTYKKRAAYLAYMAYLLHPFRGDVPTDLQNLEGLTESDDVVKNGLLGIATLGYYKDKRVGNAVSLIRFYGDNAFPGSDWNYLPGTSQEMSGTVGFCKDPNANVSVVWKVNELFYGR